MNAIEKLFAMHDMRCLGCSEPLTARQALICGCSHEARGIDGAMGPFCEECIEAHFVAWAMIPNDIMHQAPSNVT